MKPIVGGLLFAHAVAHLVGFAWPWWLLEPLPSPPSDVALIGDAGMQLLSVLWLAGAVTFSVAALALVVGARVWRPITMGAAGLSLVLSVLCWPASLLGVPINLAILTVLDRTRTSRWPLPGHVRHVPAM
jgi:hypothetical protein